MIRVLLSAALITLPAIGATLLLGNDVTEQQAAAVVQKYHGVFAVPPSQVDSPLSTDAPLLGNGDLGAAIMGNLDAMTFILGKNEFWSLKEGRVKALGRLNILVPAMAGASYRMEENIASANVTGTFSKGPETITTRTWVSGDDTTHNFLVTIFSNAGPQPQPFSISLSRGNENNNDFNVGTSGNVLYIDLRADKEDALEGFKTCQVRVGAVVIGEESEISDGALHFTLEPGKSAILVASVMSNHDSESFQTDVVDVISNKTAADIEALSASHQAYWNKLYGKSFIEIPDKRLEAEWYGSLYLMASCSHPGEAAPGLFGNWIMRNPSWKGDYTLNYNYEAPFFMTIPTNHLELSENYDKPLLDWLPKAEALAAQRGWTGAYYRVHIGPLPNGSSDTSEHNQKFCGAFAAVPIIMRYYSTRDLAYARRVYPMLKQCAIFWQNYLAWDGSRYVIHDDAQQEDDVNPQVNGVMSLGLVRYLFQACMAMSSDLHVDDDLHAVWGERLAKLSAFPTFESNGKSLFRWTETGRAWCGGNTIGIQHIFPASQIGLDSGPALLGTAQNMIAAMARWNDGNGTNTFYPAAARVGYDPAEILRHMDDFVKNKAYPNFYIHTGGGGVESFSVVPEGICEMLLQSYEGKIRLFPDWPAGMPARFGDLRADGGFLVSSAIANGKVQYVRLISEQGRSAVLVNPWPGQPVALYRNGKAAKSLDGSVLTIPTTAGETILAGPDTSSASSILNQMQAPIDGR